MVQRRLIGAVVGAVIAAGVQGISAAPLTNGGFESTTATPLATFTGWTERTLDIASVAPTGLGTGNALQVAGGAASFSQMDQAFDPITTAFTVSLNFAATDPGATNAAFRILLGNAAVNGGQMNVKLLQSGFVVHNGSAWQPTAITSVPFSSSLSSPTVNTLTIAGQFDGTANSFYTLQLNGGTPTGQIKFFQGGIPTQLLAAKFASDAATGAYVVDNLTVSVPEPAGILAAAGSLGLLAMRRRKVG